MTTLLIQDPAFERHVVPQGHPERPERLAAIRAVLDQEAFEPLVRRAGVPASEEQIVAAHPYSHLDEIRLAAETGDVAALDPDTFVSPDSYEIAKLAAGSACAAVDAVMGRSFRNAFVASRPPGHHAEAERAMGFCLFNNVVIAARHARKAHGAERVAIIDWDVHHGNGTQALAWDDPSILYPTTHQMPLYPGTGAPDETGASDNIVNAPLPPGSSGRIFREAMTDLVLPRVRAFRPDLILISAGFDAHRRDPLAGTYLDTADFAWATEAVRGVAEDVCDGGIVSVLEGGYDLEGLADSVAAHVAELMRG